MAVAVVCLGALTEPADAQSPGEVDNGFGLAGRNRVAFDLGGGDSDIAFDVAVRPTGEVLLAGRVERAGLSFDWGVAQLTLDGQSLDSGFDTDGKAIIPWNLGGDSADELSAIALQPDGQLVLAGAVDRGSHYDVGVARLTEGGTPDPGFGVSGLQTIGLSLGETALSESARDVTLQPDGKVVVAGGTLIGDNCDFLIARLGESSFPDATFSGDGVTTVPFDLMSGGCDQAYGVAVQADGKIVVGGTAAAASGVDFAVARLLANGNPDSSFGTAGKTTVAFELVAGGLDELREIAIQADGKIVLFGAVEAASGGYDFGVARLDAGGSLDGGFGTAGKQTIAFDLTGPSAVDLGTGGLVQPDGKMVVVGSVSTSSGNVDMGLARLDSAGALDPGFGTSGRSVVPFDLVIDGQDVASAVALSSGGRLLAGGRVENGTGDFDFGVAAVHSGFVFHDGFESDDATVWSATSP